ncbi:MAG: cupin domain-containing protein [Rhizobiaceae bacterium]
MTNSNNPEINNSALPPLLPIILAGGSNLEQWPLSRINMPIQFQRAHQKESAFEQVLKGVSQLHHSLPPIITLPSAALEIGRQQFSSAKGFPEAKLIVEPVDRGTLIAVITTTLIAATIDRTAMMVFIDASQPPTDWGAFSRLVYQTQNSSIAQESIVLCGQPLEYKNASLRSVEKAQPSSDPLLFNFQSTSSNTEEKTFEIGAVTFATPRVMIDKLQSLCPTMMSAANLALQQAETRKNTLWPGLNIWAAQPTQNFARTFAKNTHSTLLRPIDLQQDKPKRTSPSRLIFEQENLDCSITSNGHLLAVAGCENLHIVSTPDVTLIANKNNLQTIAPIITKLHAYERREVFDFPIRTQQWGQQREIDCQKGYSIVRLEITPGSSIPPHLHNHRAESWHVLSGGGEAIIDNMSRTVMQGISLDIPRNTVHTCKNTGEVPLVIMETRFGSLINETDSVAFELHRPFADA